MFSAHRIPLSLRRLMLILSIITLVVAGLTWQNAKATSTQTALVTITPATQNVDSGAVQGFTIAVSCAGASGALCGPNVSLAIPLSTSTTPSMTDSSWVYSASSGSSGFITAAPTLSGNSLVIGLDSSQFVSGYSGTVRLNVTAPNVTTPNHTSFSLTPSLSGDSFVTVSAPSPAVSSIKAKPSLGLTNGTSDSGSVYQPATNFSLMATATCVVNPTGALEADSAVITQQLPNGVTYVSSTPAGVYNAGTRIVTWTITSAADMPKGCNPSANGPTRYLATVTGPPSVPAIQPLVATATFTAKGPDATVPAGVSATTTADYSINFIKTLPRYPGYGYPVIYKKSLGPLSMPGVVTDNDYTGTYPGNWVPISNSPAYAPGSAAGAFLTVITSTITNQYFLKVVDPLPCLDNITGNRFKSKLYTESACAHPAFITQKVLIRSQGSDTSVNGLGRAVTAGWRPQVTLSDGSVHDMTLASTVYTTSSEAYFDVPAGASVATVTLPTHTAMRNRNLQLIIFGYAAPILLTTNGGLNDLQNTATLLPELVQGTTLSSESWTVSLATIPRVPQLGISTSFGAPGSGGAGSTPMTTVGGINLPFVPLTSDVMMTDLLPLGLTWRNTAATTTVSLSQAGGTATTATATISVVNDYQGSGRQLIRMRIPKESFTTSGTWKITPATGTFLMNTPTDLGVYQNYAQIFLFNYAPSQISSACTTPTQVVASLSTATFISSNPENLAGDGHLSEQHCQSAAALSITSGGAAFSLTKSVKGALDTLSRGALGVGVTGPRGSGVFTLDWYNVGSDSLKNVVIYDILPYVSDAGVSAGQSATARLSEMRAFFDSISAPAGVVVSYSQSLNPCRTEVYPNGSNGSCVNDWSTTAPSDLNTVRAIRIYSAATYVKGAGFSVNLSVHLDAGTGSEVAWNSAAVNAVDATTPSTVPLPAEPPKVGLRALAAPSFVTHTSSASVQPGDAVTDSIVLTDIPGTGGTLDWSLVGPLSPVNGSCAGLDWTHAATLTSGQFAVSTDGTVSTDEVRPVEAGCYSWAETLTAEVVAGSPIYVNSPAGADDEVFLVALADTLPKTGSTPRLPIELSLILLLAGGLFVTTGRRFAKR